MKLLLTSSGITNGTIANSLLTLLGKPFAESKIVFVPTAANPDSDDKSWVVKSLSEVHQLGWKDFAIADIAALNSLDRKLWWSRFEDADVIFVNGGNAFYLSYWMQKAGLFEALPELLKTKIYVGSSAGSMIVSNSLRVASQALKGGVLRDDEYDELGPAGQSSAKTLQLVDFNFRPHLNSRHFTKIRDGEFLQNIARELGKPMYALDDESALQVVDGKVTVVAEGDWHLYDA